MVGLDIDVAEVAAGKSAFVGDRTHDLPRLHLLPSAHADPILSHLHVRPGLARACTTRTTIARCVITRTTIMRGAITGTTFTRPDITISGPPRCGRLRLEQEGLVLGQHRECGRDICQWQVVFLLEVVNQPTEERQFGRAETGRDRVEELRHPLGIDILNRGQRHLGDGLPGGTFNR